MKDENDNGIPDRYEFISTCIIASISVLIGVLGYFCKDMQPEHVKWFIGFAVFLMCERDIKSFFKKK